MRRTLNHNSQAIHDSTDTNRESEVEQAITSPTSEDISPSSTPSRFERLKELSIADYYDFMTKDPMSAGPEDLLFSDLTICEVSQLTTHMLKRSQEGNISREIANKITTAFIKGLIDKVIIILRSDNGTHEIATEMNNRSNQEVATRLIHALCGESQAIVSLYQDGSLSSLIRSILELAKNSLSVYKNTQNIALVNHERAQTGDDRPEQFSQLANKITQIQNLLRQTNESNHNNGRSQSNAKISELRLLRAAQLLQVHLHKISRLELQASNHTETQLTELKDRTNSIVETTASHLCFDFLDELITFVENHLNPEDNQSQDSAQHLIGGVLGCVRLIKDKDLLNGLAQVYRIWDSFTKSQNCWHSYQIVCEDKKLKKGVYDLFFVLSRICQVLYNQSNDKKTNALEILARDSMLFLEAFSSKPAPNTPFSRWNFAEQLTLIIAIIGADWPIKRIQAISQISVNEAGKWAKSVENILKKSPNTDTRLIQLFIMMINTLIKTLLQKLPEKLETSQGIKEIDRVLTEEFSSLNDLLAQPNSGHRSSNTQIDTTVVINWYTAFQIVRYLHSTVPNILVGVIEEVKNAVPDAKYAINQILKLRDQGIFSNDNHSNSTEPSVYKSALKFFSDVANIADLIIIACGTFGQLVRATLHAWAKPANTPQNTDAAETISQLINNVTTANLITTEASKQNKLYAGIIAAAKTAAYELVYQPNTVKLLFLSVHTCMCFFIFGLCNMVSLAHLRFHQRMLDPLIHGLQNIFEIIWVLTCHPISISLSLLRSISCIANHMTRISFDIIKKMDTKWQATIGVSLCSVDWLTLRILPNTFSLLHFGLSQLIIQLQPLFSALLSHRLLQGVNGTAVVATVGVILLFALLLPQMNAEGLTTSVPKAPADPTRSNELTNEKKPGVMERISGWWRSMTVAPGLRVDNTVSGAY